MHKIRKWILFIFLLCVLLSISKVLENVEKFYANNKCISNIFGIVYYFTKANWQYGFFTSDNGNYGYFNSDIYMHSKELDSLNYVKLIPISTNLVHKINETRVNGIIPSIITDSLYTEAILRSISLYLFKNNRNVNSISLNIDYNNLLLEKCDNKSTIMIKKDLIYQNDFSY